MNTLAPEIICDIFRQFRRAFIENVLRAVNRRFGALASALARAAPYLVIGHLNIYYHERLEFHYKFRTYPLTFTFRRYAREWLHKLPVFIRFAMVNLRYRWQYCRRGWCRHADIELIRQLANCWRDSDVTIVSVDDTHRVPCSDVATLFQLMTCANIHLYAGWTANSPLPQAISILRVNALRDASGLLLVTPQPIFDYASVHEILEWLRGEPRIIYADPLDGAVSPAASKHTRRNFRAKWEDERDVEDELNQLKTEIIQAFLASRYEQSFSIFVELMESVHPASYVKFTVHSEFTNAQSRETLTVRQASGSLFMRARPSVRHPI